MSERKLPNWLKAYSIWTLPRSEAPASMVMWAGLFTLAAVAKRKVVFPKRLMGSYEIYPNLYLIFVGQPGVVRKSTTAGYAEELLLNVSETLDSESINLAATSTSSSKLLEALSKTSDCSVTVISSEFSSFIGVSREAMYEILTDIYDGKRKFTHATRAHGVELSESPVVNLIAATTPAWISKQPPEHFLGGGFASRVLFVYESERRQFKMYYDDIDFTQIELMGSTLVNDLAHIATLEGEFKHESKALRDEMEAWYIEHASSEAIDERVRGYHERKHVHVHKVAMLLSLAERDDLVITNDHFHAALLMLEQLEEKMPRALASVGSNPMGQIQDEVLDFIHRRGGEVDRATLAKRFYRDLTLDQMGELVAALNVVSELDIIANAKKPNNPIYKLHRNGKGP